MIHYSFKIITKLLANRLSPLLGKLIDQSYTTYVRNRVIFDNIVYAQEILYQVKQNKSKDILFKLDFEKAFVNVSWEFLLDILKIRGFGIRWIR